MTEQRPQPTLTSPIIQTVLRKGDIVHVRMEVIDPPEESLQPQDINMFRVTPIDMVGAQTTMVYRKDIMKVEFKPFTVGEVVAIDGQFVTVMAIDGEHAWIKSFDSRYATTRLDSLSRKPLPGENS